MKRWLSELATGVSEVIWPPRCAACDCRGYAPFCVVCAETLEAAAPFSLAGLDVARARNAYGGAIADAISRLKYQRREDLGPPLAGLLAELGTFGADVVVPVPLAPRRLRERGFNQALLLARGLDLPIEARLLLRRDGGHRQVGADRRDRAAQVQGAFWLAPRASLVGRRVLLVDDVITTGATARAAAAALRRGGAPFVAVIALARAETTRFVV